MIRGDFAKNGLAHSYFDNFKSKNFTGQASALGYDSGMYTYEFESEIETGVTLADPQARKAKVKAEVVLTAYTPCDFVLKIKSLSVSTSRVIMNLLHCFYQRS